MTTRSFPEFIRTTNPKYQFFDYVEELIKELEAVERGETTRLMIFMPPRHGKSELVSRLFSAWYLLRHPDRWVGINSYGADLALMMSRASRDNFVYGGGAASRPEGSRAGFGASLWETGFGGGCWSAGVGGPITGKGAHLAIIDDPLKNDRDADSDTIRENQKDWYSSTLYTRLEPGSALVIVQTRWHVDDLSGWLLKREQDAEIEDEREHWRIVNAPAISEAVKPTFPVTCSVADWDKREPEQALCPPRYPIERLKSIRAKLPERWWDALFQQRPTVSGGSIFRTEWWDIESGRNRYDWDDEGDGGRLKRTCIGRWIFLDTALKDGEGNDYTGMTVVELTPDYRVVVRKVSQERVLSAFLPDVVQLQAQYWNADERLRQVVIEDKASGTTLIQTLRKSAPPKLAEKIVEFQPTGTKEFRAKQASIWCSRDCVLFPYPSPSVDWLFDFTDPAFGQLFQFPNAAHDDMVDSFSMALLFLENFISQGWQLRSGLLKRPDRSGPDDQRRR